MRCHQCKEEFIDRRKEKEQFIQVIYYDHMLFHPACLPYWKEEEEKKEKARKEREKERDKKDEVLSNGQSEITCRRSEMIKVIVVLVALAVFTSLAFAQELPAIKENYDCAGTSPDGNYTLSLFIEAKEENYFLSWQGGAIVGLGFRSDDKLVVGFVNHLIGAIGVVAYKVAEDQLIGVWSGGGGKTYTESCLVGSKVKKGGKDGNKGPRVVARQAQVRGL